MKSTNYLGASVGLELMLEAEVPKDPKLSGKLKDRKVKRFVDLCQKKLSKKILPNEKKELDSLFKDPKVKAYLEASKKVGQRIGWIRGGIIGSITSLISSSLGFAALGASGAGLAALALLGAAAGGLSTGFLMSKIYGILRKWKTEEEMTKGGLQGGAVVSM